MKVIKSSLKHNEKLFDLAALKQLQHETGAKRDGELTGEPHVYIGDRQVMKTTKGGYDLWKGSDELVKPDATKEEAIKWLEGGEK